MQRIILSENLDLSYPDPHILDFINDFRSAVAVDQMQNKYSYHFASILKSLFPTGDIMWLLGTNKMIYMSANMVPYDINGVNNTPAIYISESIMDPHTVNSFRFKDIAGTDTIAKRFAASMNTLDLIADELFHMTCVSIAQRNNILAAISDWRSKVRLGIRNIDCI